MCCARIVSGFVGILLVLGGVFFVHAEPADVQSPYRVRAFGAVGDGIANDTESVQRAIDTCAEAGGGTIFFSPGAYLCGSLHLRSDVTLSLDNGATILGSRDLKDYDPYEELGFENDSDHETSFFHQALIWGEDIERVAIVGQGTIDANFQRRGGPKPIALKRCRFVEIRGIRILNAPNYAISMLGTDYVNIEGVTILDAHCDGIDPDSCRNVRISNCHIESWDDAIVPKASFSLGERRSTENITVTNCYLSTACNAFKLGTESGGDFKRIAVSNCVMAGLKGRRPAISGIALESVDGANLDGVVVSNITMVRVRAPIFIRLGNRGRDMETPVPGSVRNVSINNVVATEASTACSINGIPGHNVENVSVSDIRVSYVGGGPYRASNEPVPEYPGGYPEADMFEGLPAYAMYCRHADGVTLRNVQVSYEDGFWRQTNEGDTRLQWPNGDLGAPHPSAPGTPGLAMVCDDVRGLRVDGFQAQPDPEGASLIRFVNVRNALLAGMMASEGPSPLLEVAGERSAQIHVDVWGQTDSGGAVSIEDGVSPSAVTFHGRK